MKALFLKRQRKLVYWMCFVFVIGLNHNKNKIMKNLTQDSQLKTVGSLSCPYFTIRFRNYSGGDQIPVTVVCGAMTLLFIPKPYFLSTFLFGQKLC